MYYSYIYSFISLLFSVNSISMQEASCSSILPAIIIYYLFIIYKLIIHLFMI